MLEDGASVVSGGIGQAVAGGVLFGGVGAVVGGITGKRNEQVCRELKVKMTVKGYKDPAFYINLIAFPVEVKKDSLEYAALMKQAQAVVSKLQLIAESESENQSRNEGSINKTDVTEELRKFKRLLDDGIITQEEFNAKKKELLGL